MSVGYCYICKKWSNDLTEHHLLGVRDVCALHPELSLHEIKSMMRSMKKAHIGASVFVCRYPCHDDLEHAKKLPDEPNKCICGGSFGEITQGNWSKYRVCDNCGRHKVVKKSKHKHHSGLPKTWTHDVERTLEKKDSNTSEDKISNGLTAKV